MPWGRSTLLEARAAPGSGWKPNPDPANWSPWHFGSSQRFKIKNLGLDGDGGASLRASAATRAGWGVRHSEDSEKVQDSPKVWGRGVMAEKKQWSWGQDAEIRFFARTRREMSLGPP